MTADIVQREDAFLGVADDDLSPVQSHGAHAALGDVGQRKGLLELRIAHGRRGARVRSAHFNRDPSPGALNLCAALQDGGAPAPGPRSSLDLDLGLEDGDRLADDPDAFDGTFLDIQLHVHPPRTVQLVSLHAAE